MDQLTLKPRKAVVLEEEIENWDDDDLDIGGDDFTFRSASLATTTASTNHRDSVSSRLSGRSFDSNHGDEDRHVHLPGDDERSTIDAIATAARAGIPIPHNVPSSALTGGTIKRLGGRKLKKIIQDDWDDGDLELPGAGDGALKLKRQDASNFPDALRQVSGPGSVQSSPVKTLKPAPKIIPSPQKLKAKVATPNLLDRFRDDEDDNFFDDGGATIKVSKIRPPPKLLPLVTPPRPRKQKILQRWMMTLSKIYSCPLIADHSDCLREKTSPRLLSMHKRILMNGEKAAWARDSGEQGETVGLTVVQASLL